MTDVVVTVPKGMWEAWLAEGDLPGDDWSGYVSHFWIPRQPLPKIVTGERVYVVSHGKLRGFAPLWTMESSCMLRRPMACLMRTDEAQAVTINEPVRGFQGWRYRWWDHDAERPFPEWRTP